MGSISDKISYLEQTKREIADAIVEKGQTVVYDSDPFRSYANKIKEINSGGGSGGSITTENIYSTEEQVIGTWLDGKPIYRKAYYVDKSFPSNSDADFTSYIPNFSEMDTFIKAFGYKPSNKGFINLHGYINSNKLMLHTDWGLSLVEGTPNILILEYTKTAN